MRNGYFVVLEMWRDETPYATGGEAPDYGPWAWVASINGKDCTVMALRADDFSYPALDERDEALRKLRAFVDSLPDGRSSAAHF